MRHPPLVIAAIALAILILLALCSPPASQERCPGGQCPIDPPAYSADFVARYGSAWDPPAGSAISQLPPDWREPNYAGGSCGHASMVTLFRSCGMPEFADWWRENFKGGTSMRRVCAQLDQLGLKYAWTDSGSMEFLELCAATGRGAVIRYKPNHLINFLGIDENYVYVLDNNSVNYRDRNGDWEKIPRDVFESNWQNRYGGQAWTLLYRPLTPTPILPTGA